MNLRIDFIQVCCSPSGGPNSIHGRILAFLKLIEPYQRLKISVLLKDLECANRCVTSSIRRMLLDAEVRVRRVVYLPQKSDEVQERQDLETLVKRLDVSAGLMDKVEYRITKLVDHGNRTGLVIYKRKEVIVGGPMAKSV